MIKIKNLSEAVRKQIRLIPAEGATSDITGSTGAIAKDGEDILICLSPMVPPVQVSMTLRIIPVDKIAGLKSYYANGSTPVTPDRKIYHDLRVGDGIDVVLFSELTDEPIEVNPSDTFQSINATTAWPNPMGYLANDLREFQDTVQYHVKFPSALIAEIRAIRNETPNEVVLVEEYVDLLNAENSDTRTLTASEFINVIDNNIYFFWFGADDNPGELSYKFNLGGEEILYKIKSNLTVTKRWNPDLITLNTGINIHGLFSGLDGYGFIEFKSDIPRTDDSVEDGGGSMYQDVKANGSGGLITLGVRESIEAYVTPTGDAYIKPLLDGINNVQFSLLTETDMDLSDRGTGIPGLACHYMKTSIPEHKLFHHRFFFTYTTIVTPACVPSDPVTLVNKKLDIAHKVEPSLIGLNVFLLVAEEDQVHVVREWKAFFKEVFVDRITVKPQATYPVRVERVTPIEEKLIHWDGNTYLKCGSYDKDHAELWKKELGATSLSIELLKGRTLKRIFKEAKLEEFRKNGRSIFDGGDSIIFEDTEGYLFILHHEQDCCETVELEDVVGDLMDLLGYPLLESEEVTSDLSEVKELPLGDVKLELIGRTPNELSCRHLESATWTFYKFATIKGHVNMRWMGESNGYYSESVELTVLRPYAIEALNDTMPLLN
jgi:hypothetical protein